GQRAKNRLDVLVVADVVSVVVLWRTVEKGDPDHVPAQVGQVIQLADDAAEIADAVAVRVREAARIDLVDHRPLPPGLGAGGGCPDGGQLSAAHLGEASPAKND